MRSTTATISLVLLALSALAAMASPTAAQDNGEKDADELARELSNPTAALAGMGSNFDYKLFAGDLPGAGDQDGLSYLFQPVLPFPQGNGYNLIFRPGIPVLLDQPVIDPGTGAFDKKGVELGDIVFDLAYGTTTGSGLLYLGGIVGGLPTATHDAVGSDQWRLGPEVALGVVREWGVIGGLLSHQWDVAGEDAYDTNLTSLQYFYALSLGGGWQIAASPIATYDHEADDDALTFPVGAGLAKTTAWGSTPIKLSVQVWNYVARPDAFGPGWQFRFNFTPVVQVPWGR